jgi:alkylation response protein AidB-like acyl-CoA dehydrogenase
MTATSTTTSQEVLTRARALVPRLREEAQRIEEQGRLPPDVVAEMTEAGLFHMLLPRDYGGLEVDPVTVARVVEEVSRGDGSAGWCVMIAAQNCALAGFMDPEGAREVFADGAVLAGTARPVGRAVADPTRGGYVVSGRWPFASGSSHAAWLAGECVVYEGGQPRKGPDGQEMSALAIVPKDNATVHETWDTLGLRGTASNDFSIDSVFVPERRMVNLFGGPRHEWAAFRAFPLVFIGHGAQALGVARAAVESGAEFAAAKRGWGNVPLRDTPRVQAAVAQASVIVDAAADHLYAQANALWDLVQAGGDDPVLRAKVRLAASNAATASLQAVDLLHGLLATTAIFKTNPLERLLRDIHTATAHVMIGPLTYEAAGRVLLGKDVDFPFF